MIAVDTNILLRYLLEPIDTHNPNPQNIAARRLIDQADKVYISNIVVAELEWVLESVFGLGRTDIARLVQTLASNFRFMFDDWTALQRALLDYREHSRVDLSDCLIARCAQQAGAATLYTFEGKRGLGGLKTATTLSADQ